MLQLEIPDNATAIEAIDMLTHYLFVDERRTRDVGPALAMTLLKVIIITNENDAERGLKIITDMMRSGLKQFRKTGW